MARSELPDNWQDLAAGYVLNNLSDEEMADWKNLLNAHPELPHELEELQSTLDLLADAVPMYQPPNRVLNRIRATVQTNMETVEEPQSHLPKLIQTSEVSSPEPSTVVYVTSSDRATSWLRLGGAIAAGFIALLGFQVYSLNAQLQQANTTIQTLERDLQAARKQTQWIRPVIHTLQQPETLVYSLQGSNLANTASGRLVLSHERDVIILVQNLPELPAGKVYRLWAALPTKTALTYCGQFNSNMQGVIQLTPSTSQCGDQPTQMIITIDAAIDPTTRGGPVVMQGQI